jgi:alpha-tubulin suppressor-like RCC1 family protein
MSHHTVFNTRDGIYVCGDNDYGQLGLGDYTTRTVLTKLPFDHDVISIHLGSHHTIFNTYDGIYFCGKLTRDYNTVINIPTKLPFDHDIISIHCGANHTIFYTIDGIFVHGNNEFGQLGLGDNNNRKVPTKLPFDHEIMRIHCGLENFNASRRIKSAATMI